MLSAALAEVAVPDTEASILLAALGIGFGSVFGGFLEGNWDPTLLGRGAGIFWWLGAVHPVRLAQAARRGRVGHPSS